MKIQLDTENKTIKIEGNVLLSDVIETLEKLLPKGLWKTYELQCNTTIVNWTTPYTLPVTIPYFPSPIWVDTNKTMPFKKYEVTCQSGNETFGLEAGTYNIVC